ncbi:2-hydroxyacyl-CoA dehydratase family protein [Methanosphaerula palustris]|uniref:2-hydroxyglutaryl-CoA dehydratase D-component n=1 Tax=Methanosphaerula palustris (strain ATCC BAA-1556 / DSM 19958 / E1-9c) TaxID=521011 RepID=B8GH73_METPE|nr:2-hydroxyacyl-CoA dehydratase family protein [Methanosphaerula palustris]ACL16478.1 2-hydroxyglutaryl-CoA dehydratase D-component [Methanosphaerula palustris E1-9c]
MTQSAIKLFQYPESLKERFLQTSDIEFRYSKTVTPEEIWHFMTVDAPRRYPYAYEVNPYFRDQISADIGFLTGIKSRYLRLSLKDRLLNAHENGVPIIFTQGGQTFEPYYTAGGIPLRPGLISRFANDLTEGQTVNELGNSRKEKLEFGNKLISTESCPIVGAHVTAQRGIVPVDLVAPYLCLRCSDKQYLVESYRNRKNVEAYLNPASRGPYFKENIPLMLIDYPIDQQNEKDWAIDYLETMLRNLTAKVSELSGKEVNDQVLAEEIRYENKVRKLTQNIVHLWWNAPVPPTNSSDFVGTSNTSAGLFRIGNEFSGDPNGAYSVLKDACAELQERVRNGVKGVGVADDPVRIYICGPAATESADPGHIDRVDGVVVGKDDQWSEISTLVDEGGNNPYRNLARAILSFPMELPTEERAAWTIEQVKKSRADGLIFTHTWGCNFQSSVARMICDIVRDEAGIPVMDTGTAGGGPSLLGEEQSKTRLGAFIEMISG